MLRPKKHITRKKIKEDKFVTRTLQTADWLKRNRRPLLGAGVVLVLAMLAVTGWVSARRAAEEQASVLTLQGGYALQDGDLESARDALTRAVTMYGGTRSAGRALFMLAQIQFQDGTLDSARTSYQMFLDRYARDDMTRAGATAGLAACAEQSGDYATAAGLYEEAARIGRVMGLEATNLLEAARCFRLAGQKDQAIRLYQRVKDEFDGAGEADRAAIEMAELAFVGG